MTITLRSIAVILFMAFANTLLFAQTSTDQQPENESAVDVKVLLGVSLEFGGDAVATVFFDDGEDQDVNAGQGFHLFTGAQFAFKAVPQFYVHATAGLKYVTTAADNAHIRLMRYPVQLMGYYKLPYDINIGAGVSKHLNINFKADGLGEDFSMTSDAAPRFEINWNGIGLNYTIQTYTDDFGEDFNASHFGISFVGAFPQ